MKLHECWFSKATWSVVYNTCKCMCVWVRDWKRYYHYQDLWTSVLFYMLFSTLRFSCFVGYLFVLRLFVSTSNCSSSTTTCQLSQAYTPTVAINNSPHISAMVYIFVMTQYRGLFRQQAYKCLPSFLWYLSILNFLLKHSSRMFQMKRL
jgi:hypothetical protein